jgi:TPR repeat protein
MLRFHSKKLTFVSFLALSIAFQTAPILAMEPERPQKSQKNQEYTSDKIDYYYNNPHALEDILSSCSSSDSSYSSDDESSDEGENPIFSFLKVEGDKGNTKAKLLHFYAKLFDWDRDIDSTEWTPISEWLAQQENDPLALLWLGIFAEEDWEGHPSDEEMAEAYYLQAAELGQTSAYKRLADLIHYGPGCLVGPDCGSVLDPDNQPDIDKAITYYKKAIESGDTSLPKSINHYFKKPHEIEGDDPIALELLKIEAKKGNPQAKILHFYSQLLGLTDSNDENSDEQVHVDTSEWTVISEWLTQQENDPFALLWLGIFAGEEWEGHPSNPEQAEHYYLLASQKGNASTYMTIAWMYREVDQEKAEQYYLLAAEKGYKWAYNALAFFLHHEVVDFKKAEKYYLLHAEKGHKGTYNTLTYNTLGSMFQHGSNGQFIDFEKAEKYYLLAAENGNTSVYSNLGSMFHHGSNGQFIDLAKAEKYYLLAVENGDMSVYSSLGSMFHHGSNGQFIDFEKAEKYYLLGDHYQSEAYTYYNLGMLYEFNKIDDPTHKDKAVQYYTKAVQKGIYLAFAADRLGDLYQNGWNDQPASPEKAVYYFTKTLQQKDYYREKDVKDNLKNLCFFSELPSTSESTLITVSEVQPVQIEEKWKTVFLCFNSMVERMGWQHDMRVMAFDELTEPIKDIIPYRPCDKGKHYEIYLSNLLNISNLLSKVLEENSFCFMTPRKEVKEHLLKNFTVYNPLKPTPCDEVGLCLYNMGDDNIVFTFGNENVKLCHSLMNLLKGENSLASLLEYHQNKIGILEKLKTQMVGSQDEESSGLIKQILTKPALPLGCLGEDPKPCFRDMLLMTLKDKHGLDEEKAKLCIDKKIKRVASNILIDQCIHEEMEKHVDLKIQKSVKKIALLESVVETFKDMLLATHPRKAARFKEDYDFLGEMF